MKKIAVLTVLLVLAFSGCDDSSSSDEGTYFWAADNTKDYVNSSAGWYKVNATLQASGTYSEVYVEDGRTVDAAVINDIISEFDNNIYPKLTTNFGSPSDIDNNGKVTLLLLDIKDTYQDENDSYIGGYFFSVDLFSQDELTGIGYPRHYKSNEREMLYIDINPGDPTSESLKSTVAHEFQHLINFSNNVIVENGYPMPVWVDEGFAMAAEAIYQDVDILLEREYWYHYDPLYSGQYGSLQLTKDIKKSIAFGYPLVYWNPYPDNQDAVLNNYALSHLFFSWLRIHKKAAGDSDTFFKDIMNDTDNTFTAVLNECGNLGSGTEVNTAEKMIDTFYMANLLGGNYYNSSTEQTISGKTTGLDSYLGKNEHYGPFVITMSDWTTYYPGENSISLYPGGAVNLYKLTKTGWSPSGGSYNISYATGNWSNETSDFSAPYNLTNSDVLIVTNVDTTTDADPVASAPISSVQAPDFEKRGRLLYNDENLQRNTFGNIDPPQGAFRKGFEQ